MSEYRVNPCPFCGRAPDVTELDGYDCARDVGYSISCDPCYVRMNAFRISQTLVESPEVLVARWNARAPAAGEGQQ
jgi:hypothetical protein